MSAEAGEALEVLREVWRSQDQAGALDDGCELTSCKRMVDAGVGFEEFGEGGADLAAAWRDRLRREGKYNAAGGTLGDLIAQHAPAGPPA